MPLMIIASNPSQLSEDPAAKRNATVTSWNTGMAKPKESLKNDSLLRNLIAKPTVHAIIWNQASDQVPHEFPHAGLWDNQGKPKSFLNYAAQLRQRYLH